MTIWQGSLTKSINESSHDGWAMLNEHSKTFYDLAMPVFIRPFLAENANGGLMLNYYRVSAANEYV